MRRKKHWREENSANTSLLRCRRGPNPFAFSFHEKVQTTLKKARHQCLQDGPAGGAPIALSPGSWDLCDSCPGEKCCQGEGVRVLPASAASPRASTKKGLASRKKGQSTSPARPPTSKTGFKVPGLHIRASLKVLMGRGRPRHTEGELSPELCPRFEATGAGTHPDTPPPTPAPPPPQSPQSSFQTSRPIRVPKTYNLLQLVFFLFLKILWGLQTSCHFVIFQETLESG